MNIIIFGLGNNEKKYLTTKHNIGRLFVEELAIIYNQTFSKLNIKNTDNLPHFSKINLENNNILFLLYSDEYMNNSGKCLDNFVRYFKIDLQNADENILLIVQDDSDIISLNQKLVIGGGSAGHNGISSINKYFQTNKDKMLRLKIGIRPELNKLKSETFVLNQLTENEIIKTKSLAKVFQVNISLMNSFSAVNLSKLQTIINSL